MSFFLLWLSFNNWMGCVTGMERDAEMIRDLGNDVRLNTAFVDLTTNVRNRNQDQFQGDLRDFSRLWPVFKAQDVIAKHGLEYSYRFATRREFNAAIVNDATIKRKPVGWVEGSTPRWSDLIATIYQVRCNLIHGHKSMARDGDRELVGLSRNLLLLFIIESNCYEW
jgi:hypothetical protein